MSKTFFTIPNLVSLLRIFLVPVLCWAAYSFNRPLFLWCFAGSLFTDFLDGFLARLLNQQSKLGSQLDTVGDVLTGMALLFAGFTMLPEPFVREWPWVLVSVSMLSVSGFITLWKYRHLPSYHTWSAKLSTAVLGLGLWFFFAGVTPWGLRAGVILLCFSALEEALITLILPAWRPNVPHVFCAMQLREEAEEETVPQSTNPSSSLNNSV